MKMLQIVLDGFDDNGIPEALPPEVCDGALDCDGIRGECAVHDLPYPDARHMADKLTDLAALAFRDFDAELVLNYLDRASEYQSRPYDRLLKGYRKVDRAMYRTSRRRNWSGCPEWADGERPYLHLIRAGCWYADVTSAR